MGKTIIQKDPEKGRGVYTQDLIPKGNVIEVCQLLIFPLKSVPVELEGYVYQYTNDKVALALGNGSLYNHTDKSNARFYFNFQKKLLYIEAKRLILPGEEITINYGYNKATRNRFGIK